MVNVYIGASYAGTVLGCWYEEGRKQIAIAPNEEAMLRSLQTRADASESGFLYVPVKLKGQFTKATIAFRCRQAEGIEEPALK